MLLRNGQPQTLVWDAERSSGEQCAASKRNGKGLETDDKTNSWPLRDLQIAYIVSDTRQCCEARKQCECRASPFEFVLVNENGQHFECSRFDWGTHSISTSTLYPCAIVLDLFSHNFRHTQPLRSKDIVVQQLCSESESRIDANFTVESEVLLLSLSPPFSRAAPFPSLPPSFSFFLALFIFTNFFFLRRDSVQKSNFWQRIGRKSILLLLLCRVECRNRGQNKRWNWKCHGNRVKKRRMATEHSLQLHEYSRMWKRAPYLKNYRFKRSNYGANPQRKS